MKKKKPAKIKCKMSKQTVLVQMRWLMSLNAPIATKVVCFFCLLKCLRSLYGKQCVPRSDCSYRSSLFWVHAVCFYTYIVSNVRQLFAADDFSRRHFQMHFSLGALRDIIYAISFGPILLVQAFSQVCIVLIGLGVFWLTFVVLFL